MPTNLQEGLAQGVPKIQQLRYASNLLNLRHLQRLIAVHGRTSADSLF
jgi:hypothetical protein